MTLSVEALSQVYGTSGRGWQVEVVWLPGIGGGTLRCGVEGRRDRFFGKKHGRWALCLWDF
jgi:hypothetical protein